MDSKNGGLSSEEKQRLAAEEIVRQKVLAAYEKRNISVAEKFIKKSQKRRPEGVLGTSTTPVLRQVTDEEWKKYHTAWQNYYQKYYSDYYINAAKEYVAKNAAKKAEINGGEVPKIAEVGSALNSPEKQSSKEKKERSFKARIQARAMEQAKRRTRRTLTPIFAGLAVVLTILFLQYNRLIFAPIAAYVSPGEAPDAEISELDPTVTLTKVSAENKLIIPKLNVEVPIAFGVSLDGVMSAMNSGVVHYRINGASALPGEIGNFVITGHSAGDIYSSNQYKFIFSGLERLEEGDIIYVHYNSIRYTYKMVRSEVIEPTEVSKLVYETDKPILTLVTCWPLGTSRYRLLVVAEQISPSYDGAEEASSEELIEATAEGATMPTNELTLFERIWQKIKGE